MPSWTAPCLLAAALAVARPAYGAAGAGAPVVAHLSTWVAPELRPALAQACQRELAPLLAAHGWVPSAREYPLTPDSVLVWVFEFASVDSYVVRLQALAADPRVESTWRELTARFALQKRGSPFRLVERSVGEVRATGAGAGRVARAGAGTRRGPWHVLGVPDGLPDPAVLSVFEDRVGNLWFGTEGGVSRFDGQEVLTLTTADGLVHNSVSSIAQDRAGNLWFGTGTWRERQRGGGLSRYDGRSFWNLTDRNALGHGTVTAVLPTDDGAVWFATRDGGATRLEGDRLRTFGPEDGLAGRQVLCMARDRAGGLWLGTDRGASRYDGHGFTSFRAADGLADDAVLCLRDDGAGGMWFGTEGGVSRYDGQRFVTYRADDGLAESTVTAVLADRTGALWFGHWDRGVTRFDGRSFARFGPEDGLAHWRVPAIVEDRGGDLWFGGGGDDASGNGVTRYSGDEFITYTAADGLPSNQVMCLAEDRAGRLWAGTWEGAGWFDGTRFVSLPGLRANVRAIHQDRSGRLWLGTSRNGLFRYDDGRLTSVSAPGWSPGQWVEAIAEDEAGRLWFGTFGAGVSCLDGQRWTTYTSRDGLASNSVGVLLIDRTGSLWCGTEGFGVTRLDGVRWTSLTARDGLAGDRVQAIAEDSRGVLWFGTEEGGASRYDGRAFTSLTTADGLPSNRVVHILAEGDSLVWLSTYGGGVARYDGTALQSLQQPDGLAHDAAQQVCRDRRGDYWIATEGGLTRYRPRAETVVARVTAVTGDRAYDPTAPVSLPSSQGLLTFEFTGRSFRTRPEQMTYVYRLGGQDSVWQQVRGRRKSYTGLAAGRYLFQVRAVNRDLAYSAPAEVAVRIRPPYERLAWLTALGVACAGALWQTVRVVRRDRYLVHAVQQLTTVNQALSGANRELSILNEQLQQANAQIREATRRKSEFLRRMSHDLRTPMNAIIGYTRLVIRKASEALDERQRRNLGNILASANGLLYLINQILDLSRVEAGRVEVKPREVDLQELVRQCVETLAPVVPPAVALRLELAEVPAVRTDPEVLRRALTNLLSNAAKFTAAGSVTVSLNTVGQGVAIAVSDTGIGIPAGELPLIFEEFHQVARRDAAGKEGSGLGLAIARKSVELLGGTLTVRSELGCGSTFTIELPAQVPAPPAA